MASFLDYVHALTGGKNTLNTVKNNLPAPSIIPNSGAATGGATGVQAAHDPFQSIINGSNQFSNLVNGAANYVNSGAQTTPYGAPGGAAGGGGAAGAYNLQPQQVDPSAQLRDDIGNKIRNIQSVYDAMNRNVDAITNERAGQYQQNYAQQTNDLNNSYKQTANQLGGAYGARGLGDSSYYGNAQTDAGNTYQQNLNSINQNQQQTLGQLGQFAQSQHASLQNGNNQYADILNHLGDYDVAGLQGLQPQLQTAYGNLQAQSAGFGTNQSFLDGLNKIAPVANQGTSQLAQQLQSLVTSGAPKFAKSQIAQGLIKQAQLQDPGAVSYWNNYYQQLLNGQ
jgi:hypothetical protein